MVNDHLAPFGNRVKVPEQVIFIIKTHHHHHNHSRNGCLYMVEKALRMNRKHTSERVKDSIVYSTESSEKDKAMSDNIYDRVLKV